MATNFVQEGKAIYTVTGSGMTSGQPIVLGNHLPGVLLTDADSTDSNKATVATEGIFDLSVWAWNGSARSAVALGDALYWNSAGTPATLNKDAARKFYGVALETLAHADGDTTTGTIKVLLLAKGFVPASITATELGEGSVTETKIGAAAVTAVKIDDGAVTTAKIDDGAVTTAKSNAALLKTVEKSFTAAEIKTLYSANSNKGLEILAAPGATKMIEFVSAAFWYDYTETYTATNGLTFTLDGTAVSTLVAATLLEATADRAAFCEALSTGANAAAASLLNKKLFLQEGTENPDGASTAEAELKVIVTYRIHDFA